MKQEPLFVAFSTQKGGIGKTVLTVLTASYLHYVKGYSVAVVDCDYPQHSISDMRERDSKLIMSDPHFKRLAYNQFTTLQRNAYPVVESTPEEAIKAAEQLISTSDEPFDFVFFDLPGTLNSSGVIRTLSAVDYIFAPVSADRVVLESTLEFATMLNDKLITTGKTNIKGLHILWNMVDGREKSELYGVYEGVIAQLGLQVMKTFIPDSKKFRRELSSERKPIFRSTLFPIDKSLRKGSNIEELTDEMCQIFNDK